jgi:hypothetical protein
MGTRQSSDATANGGAGSGAAGRSPYASPEQSAEKPATSDLTLAAGIPRVVARPGIANPRRRGVSWPETEITEQQDGSHCRSRHGLELHTFPRCLVMADDGRTLARVADAMRVDRPDALSGIIPQLSQDMSVQPMLGTLRGNLRIPGVRRCPYYVAVL